MSIIGNPIIVGVNPSKILPSFTYSGNYKFGYEKLSDNTYNWELAILSGSSLNLRFSQVVDKVDIFICGSGSNGGVGYQHPTISDYVYGGSGGNGGQIQNIYNVSIAKNTNYAITIGSAGVTTSINIGGTVYSCTSGGGLSGGAGANVSSSPSVGGNGSNGYIAFANASTNNRDSKLLGWDGYKYGASGGGGAVRSKNGTIRGVGSGGLGSVSGNHGGGDGGMWDNNKENGGGKNGVANSGGGGGGGAYYQSYYQGSSGSYYYLDFGGGTGGSGIIIIRNHRL